VREGRVVLARGALSAACSPTNGTADLATVSEKVWKDLEASEAIRTLPLGGLHLRSRDEMQLAGVARWAFVAEGCCAAMLLPIDGGSMIVLSEYDNGLGFKDITWLRAMAAKVGGVLERLDAQGTDER
jgi:hypothetical protein